MKIGIVGAGQAACTLVAELVRGQFAGKILVFNGELHRPYQRPPLSKTWLHNPSDTESIRLLPEPIAFDLQVMSLTRCLCAILLLITLNK